jgi:2-methylcitrate dehydratase PrpD
MNEPATFDRRSLLARAGATALIAASGAASGETEVPAAVAAPLPLPAGPPPEVTRALARYATEVRLADLPEPVRQQGVRTLLNWTGCAIGGSRHEAVDKAIAALDPFCGAREALIPGRGERVDVFLAALVAGISSHVFDFDDTHLKTIIHPAGPVASAILAWAQRRPVRGADFLNALLIGVETECRIGNAVYPSHYDLGWHITGTCGAFGSAVACGRLMQLDAEQMGWALGLAASQPVGLKVQFGSMTKSFHPGRAAQNGLLAALLAGQGYTTDPAALEGRDGWAQALSREHDWRQVTDGLGTRFESALNTYKPFACGIVTHPAIDAAIQLRREFALQSTQISAVELRANPLVLSLTGKTDPRSGLEAKFSIYYCIAAGIVYGAAGERQFSDAAVRDPAIAALRARIRVRTDPAVAAEQAELTIHLVDGRVLYRRVEHAIGSLERPMSDAALDAKFTDLAAGILEPARIRQVIDLCRALADLPDAAQIARAAATSAPAATARQPVPARRSRPV